MTKMIKNKQLIKYFLGFVMFMLSIYLLLSLGMVMEHYKIKYPDDITSYQDKIVDIGKGYISNIDYEGMEEFNDLMKSKTFNDNRDFSLLYVQREESIRLLRFEIVISFIIIVLLDFGYQLMFNNIEGVRRLKNKLKEGIKKGFANDN